MATQRHERHARGVIDWFEHEQRVQPPGTGATTQANVLVLLVADTG
jgi:hypothetical protein